MTVLDLAIAALPENARPRPGQADGPKVMASADSAGATHVFAAALRRHGIGFSLAQSEPNPGSRSTSVRFSIPAREHVVLRVFDVGGRLLMTPVDATLDPGAHSARIHTSGLPGGVYFYRLEAGEKKLSRRFAVLP